MDSQSEAIGSGQGKFVPIKFKLDTGEHRAGLFSCCDKADQTDSLSQGFSLNLGGYAVAHLRDWREVFSIEAVDSSLEAGAF